MRKSIVALTTAGVSVAVFVTGPHPAEAADCQGASDLTIVSSAVTPDSVVIGTHFAQPLTVSASSGIPCEAVRVRATVGDTRQGPGNQLVRGDQVDTWAGEITISPSDLDNTMAGTVDTTLMAYEFNDEDEVVYQREVNRDLHLYRAAQLTVNAYPEAVKRGATLTVTGRLQRANWDEGVYQGYPNRTVTLMFRVKNGSYAAVQQVTSGAGGALRATVPADQDGYWVWDYAGNATTAKARPAGDYIDVR